MRVFLTISITLVLAAGKHFITVSSQRDANLAATSKGPVIDQQVRHTV